LWQYHTTLPTNWWQYFERTRRYRHLARVRPFRLKTTDAFGEFYTAINDDYRGVNDINASSYRICGFLLSAGHL
jgi:hypothetical protein